MTDPSSKKSDEGKTAHKIKKVKKVKRQQGEWDGKEELAEISNELQQANEPLTEEPGEHAARLISVLDARIRELEGFGIDVSHGKAMLIQAAMALQSSDYESAMQSARSGIEIMEAIARQKGSELIDGAACIVAEISDAFGNIESTSQLANMIASVHSQMEAGNFQDALDNAVKVKGLAVRLESNGIKEAIDELELQSSYFAEMRFELAATSEAVSLIKSSKEAMENTDYSKALRLAKDARKIISELSEKFIREVLSALKPVLSSIDDGMAIEQSDGTKIPASQVKAKLAALAHALSAQKRTESLKIACDLWQCMRVFVWRKKAEAQLASAEAVIADREAKGLDIPQAKKMLAEAKRRLGACDLEKAFTYAVNAEENAKIFDGLSSTDIHMDEARPLIYRKEKEQEKESGRETRFSPELIKEIKPGCSYLITSDLGMKLVRLLVHDGDDALVISRNFSKEEKKLISDFKISSIKLTTTSGKNDVTPQASMGIPVGIIGLGSAPGTLSQGDEVQMNPQNLHGISSQIKNLIASSEKCVVLLRDLDYLITQNEFKGALRFVQEVVEHVGISSAKLIVEAEVAMMDEKEIKLLERELTRL